MCHVSVRVSSSLSLSVDLKCTPAQSLALIWRQRAHRIQRPSGRSSSALGAEAVAVCSRDVSLLVWRFRAASLSGVWACVVPHHNALCVRCFRMVAFVRWWAELCRSEGLFALDAPEVAMRELAATASDWSGSPDERAFTAGRSGRSSPPVPQVSKRQFDSTANEIRITF